MFNVSEFGYIFGSIEILHFPNVNLMGFTVRIILVYMGLRP